MRLPNSVTVTRRCGGAASLIWATFFGFAVFGELPDRWTIVGALVIAGSGLYIAHRERVRRSVDNP